MKTIHINESDDRNNFKIKKFVDSRNSVLTLSNLLMDAKKHNARLGQELVNQDYVEGVFPTLFYCTENFEVMEWFYENIVNWEI